MSSTPLTFVIGDIHGMSDALDSVLQGVYDYIHRKSIDEYKIIFLGDYIDRGPDSQRVVETIRQLQLVSPDRIITLRGNHEQMLLDAFDDPMHGELFYFNGGKQTLQSYNLPDLEDLPARHMKFFRETRHCYEDELRYYVHAGVSPYRKLSEQNNEDRLWIRESFLASPGPFEKYIIHGHSPRDRVDLYAGAKAKYRMNLDFGAVFGGSLVCAFFNDTQAEPFDYIKIRTPSRPMRP